MALQQAGDLPDDALVWEESMQALEAQPGCEKRMQTYRTMMTGVSQLVNIHRGINARILQQHGKLSDPHQPVAWAAGSGSASSSPNDIAPPAGLAAPTWEGQAVGGMLWHQSAQSSADAHAARSGAHEGTTTPMYARSFANTPTRFVPSMTTGEKTSHAHAPRFADPFINTLDERMHVQGVQVDAYPTFRNMPQDFHPQRADTHKTGPKEPWWMVVEAHAAAALRMVAEAHAAAALRTAMTTMSEEVGLADEGPLASPAVAQPPEEGVPMPAKLAAGCLSRKARGGDVGEEFLGAPPVGESTPGVYVEHDDEATASRSDGKTLGKGRPLREIPPGTTTLLVRNIPARYAHIHLLGEWTDHTSFDFLYRPYSLALKRNMGHALINFVSPEAAAAFQRQWHGKRLSDHGHTRALDISMADVQGYMALLVHFGPKIESIKNPAILPVVIRDGISLDPKQEAARVCSTTAMAAMQCQ